MKTLLPASTLGPGTGNTFDECSSHQRRDGCIDDRKGRREQGISTRDIGKEPKSHRKDAACKVKSARLGASAPRQTLPLRKSACSIQLQRPGFPGKG